MSISRRFLFAGVAAATMPGVALALAPNQKIPVLMNGAQKPSLDFNFAAGNLDSRLVVTRAAGGATYFDSTGTLQIAAANTARIDYDPITLACRGLFDEAASKNLVANPRGEGGTTGVPVAGTTNAPTGWNFFPSGTTTFTLNPAGQENGIPYTEIRLQDTNATGTTTYFYFTPLTGQACAQGNNAFFSVYLRQSGGSLANVGTPYFTIDEWNGGTYNGATNSAAITFVNAALVTQKKFASRVIATASTTSVAHALVFNTTGPVDMTFRIAGMQSEVYASGGATSSLILPPAGTPAQTTRAQDVIYMPASGSWYDAKNFSIAIEYNLAVSVGGQGAFALTDNIGTAITSLYGVQFAGGFDSTTYVGAAVAAASPNTISDLGIHKYAFGTSITGNSFGCVDGGSVTTASFTPYSFPTVTKLIIGDSRISSTPLRGYVRRLRVWKRLLSAQEAQSYST